MARFTYYGVDYSVLRDNSPLGRYKVVRYSSKGEDVRYFNESYIYDFCFQEPDEMAATSGISKKSAAEKISMARTSIMHLFKD